MSKKKGKETPALEPVVNDPVILEKEKIMKRWAANGEETLLLIKEVQQLLETLTLDLEENQRQVAKVEAEAEQVFAFKPDSSFLNANAPRKPRSKQGESPLEIHAESTTSLSSRTEEKRRHKAANALKAFFYAPITVKEQEAVHMKGEGKSNIPSLAASTVNRVPLSLGGTQGQRSPSSPAREDPQRPRDVPPAQWDEMLALRARRAEADAKLAGSHAEVQRQLKRLHMLQSMYEISIYGCGSAKNSFQKMMSEWQDRVKAAQEVFA